MHETRPDPIISFEDVPGTLEITPSPFPEETRQHLKEVLDSPLGSRIRRIVDANGKISVVLNEPGLGSFQAIPELNRFYYALDVTDYAAIIPASTTTVGALLAHEIGHLDTVTPGFNYNSETAVIRDFENVFRAHKGLALRRLPERFQ